MTDKNLEKAWINSTGKNFWLQKEQEWEKRKRTEK